MQFKEGMRERYEKGFANQEGDPYGERCFTYARDWANLMERQVARGAAVSDIADKTSHAADTDGITGYMFGTAVAILADCWVYGEELRKWHNKSWGQPESKGVVNPAILHVEVPNGKDLKSVIKQAARDAGMTPMDDLSIQ